MRVFIVAGVLCLAAGTSIIPASQCRADAEPTTMQSTTQSATGPQFSQMDPKTGKYIPVTDPAKIAKLKAQIAHMQEMSDRMIEQMNETPDQRAARAQEEFLHAESQAPPRNRKKSPGTREILGLLVLPLVVVILRLAWLFRVRKRRG